MSSLETATDLTYNDVDLVKIRDADKEEGMGHVAGQRAAPKKNEEMLHQDFTC